MLKHTAATFSELSHALYGKALKRQKFEYDHAPNAKGRTNSKAVPVFKDDKIYVNHEGKLMPINAISIDLGGGKRAVACFSIR